MDMVKAIDAYVICMFQPEIQVAKSEGKFVILGKSMQVANAVVLYVKSCNL